MCTLSSLTGSGRLGVRLRVVMNRDEQRSRARAQPPVVRTFGGIHGVFPIDPHSGGTWIGANSAGLVLAVLNASQPPTAATSGLCRSRGVIVPGLLECERTEEVADRVGSGTFAGMPPCRLLVVDSCTIRDFRWDGQRLDRHRWNVDRPFMATSSSLGDDLVETPRGQLFDSMLARGATFQAQDAFHRHSWDDRRDISVMMSRPDARTLSRTVVEVSADSVRMIYQDLETDTIGLRTIAPTAGRRTEVIS
ncbi:MAG: NRDE family protein [Phycisphaerales bacterium]|nr:NRDE family protein [Planctomycetota bacterium]